MKKLRKTGFSGACESLKKKCQEVCPQERFELRVELWEEGGIKVSSAQKSTESHSSRECSGAHCTRPAYRASRVFSYKRATRLLIREAAGWGLYFRRISFHAWCYPETDMLGGKAPGRRLLQ